MSLLRAEEKKREQAAAPKVNTALQEYLKKYEDPSAKPKGKKKKTKGVAGSAVPAIRIIDEDVLGESSVRKPPSFAADGRAAEEEDARAMNGFGDEDEDDAGVCACTWFSCPIPTWPCPFLWCLRCKDSKKDNDSKNKDTMWNRAPLDCTLSGRAFSGMHRCITDWLLCTMAHVRWMPVSLHCPICSLTSALFARVCAGDRPTIANEAEARALAKQVQKVFEHFIVVPQHALV